MRKSNIEALRIFSMLLICMGHGINHSFLPENLPLTINGLFSVAMSQGARIAVDSFVLISGYYTTSNKIKWDKIKDFHIQILTYSVCISTVLWLTGNLVFSGKEVINTFFPILTSRYWFATSFFFLLVISPLLVSAVESLPQRVIESQLVILGFFWIVSGTIFMQTPEFSNLGWFVYMFVLGQYFRKYPPPICR